MFATEAIRHLLAFSFATVFAELYLLYHADADPAFVLYFPLLVAGVFFLCGALEFIFRFFTSDTFSAFFSIVPSLVLLFMLRRIDRLPILQIAIILSAVLRILISIVLKRRYLPCIQVFLLDAVTLFLYFSGFGLKRDFLSVKLLCICLVILTMYIVQSILPGRGSSPFPIHFFLCVGILSALVPMKTTPIDWTPVIRLGEKIAEGIETTADNASYFFSTAFGGTYTAGYSSLAGSGDRLSHIDRLQLLLETDSLPYHSFRNEETKSYEKVRKTLYLTGGRGADRTWFVNFLNFLYRNGAGKDTASLFSEKESVSLEYVYLDTHDEIAPSTAFLLTTWDRKIESGVSSSMHRKGYRLNAVYLDIDYASPYLAKMLESEESIGSLDYDSAVAYADDLWGIHLEEVLGREEYEKALREIAQTESDLKDEYLDATGTDEKLSALADDITKGAFSDYEKCLQIEKFLRQYAYSENSVGGYDEDSDMSSSRGMADISGRFLFDTGRGYCVHFTSSMVMLLRLSGIPARAVTGYRYAFPFEKADEYRVSSSCAHTWPEAYIKGAGWIPFEPTSGYYSQSDSTWHRYSDPLGDNVSSDLQKESPASVPMQADPAKEQPQTESSLLLAIRLLWPFIASAALLILLLIAGTRLIRYLHYKYASPSKKLLSDVEMIKRNLVRLSGKKVTDRGLLSDYMCLAPVEMQKDLLEVFSACYRILYGSTTKNTPSPEENNLARSVRKKLEKQKTS